MAKFLGGVVGLCVVLMIAVFALGGSSAPRAAGDTSHGGIDDIDAWIACRTRIKNSLKAPSTADFPWGPTTAGKLDDGGWLIGGWVDAQNGFGAQIRTTFTCDVGPDGHIRQVE